MGIKLHRYILFPALMLLLSSCIGRQDLLEIARMQPGPGDVTIYSDLAVIGAQTTSNTGVRVYFSEEVEQFSAETAGNYLIPGLSVVDAVRDPADFSIVQLTTSQQNGVTYSLTVDGVRDSMNLPIGFNNVVTFFGDAAPSIQSAASFSNTEVRIYFSEGVEQTSAEAPSNYSIPGLTVVSATRDTADYTQVSLVTSSQGGGTLYTLTVTCVRDINGNLITSPNSHDFTGTGVVDTTPPQLLSAVMVDTNTVELRFSEPMDQTTSESAANYLITDNDSNNVPVSTAARQVDQSKVWLNVSDYFTRSSYTVTVNTAVQDLSGNFLMGPPDNEASFSGMNTVIVYVDATSTTSVRVQFSTEVELTKAQNKNNYSIPGLTINSAARDSGDYSIVDLMTTPQEDLNYTLTVVNVIDQDSGSFAGDVPPYLVSVTSSSNTGVTVYFSEEMDKTSAENASNYYILALTVLSATRDPSDFSKVTLQTASQNGSTLYTLEVSSVRDLTANPIVSPSSQQFLGTGTVDTNPPDVLAAELVDNNTACVLFSEPVEQGSAENLSYYTIEDSKGNAATVVSAIRQIDAARVWLDVAGTFSDSLYTVTVGTGVKDLSGNFLLGPPDNRACFSGLGTPPEIFDEGPIVVDPFEESSNSFCLLTQYRGRVYLGPANGDDAVFRVKPDGTDPELVTMVFHAASVITYTLNPGPGGENGIDCIAGGTINGEEYLFVGPARSGGDLQYIYYTKESGTTLNFEGMDIKAVLGPQTKGVSSMIVFNGNLYIGFPDEGGSRPYFVKVINIKPDPVENVDIINLEGDKMPRIGTSGSPDNRGGKIGIDSFGIYNDRLYLGNGGKPEPDADGGIIRSTNNDPKSYGTVPSDWEDVTQVGVLQWYSGMDRFSLEINDVNRLTPAQKAFPAMAAFYGNLYVIRNSTNSFGGPQLWRYDGGSWMLIADNGMGVTTMGSMNNKQITLLVVNGDCLYIGFDNPVEGVQVWRTLPGVTDPLVQGDFEPVTTDGLGDPANNQRIYHGFSAADAINPYLWLLCGRDGSNLRVYRTNNN